MTALTVLRVLAGAAVVGLAVLLARLLLHRQALAGRARAAWTAVAVIELAMIAGYLHAETLALVTVVRPDASAWMEHRRALYNPVYYLNAVLIAALPALLMRVLSGDLRVRAAGATLAAAIAIAGVGGFLLGATSSWPGLLGWTRAFTLAGIAGYLTVWALVAVERLPAMDVYLAAFLLMRTLYEIVKPVQELFFQEFTAAEAASIWHLHLFLQLLQRLGMIGAVAMLLSAVRRGRPPRTILAARPTTLHS